MARVMGKDLLLDLMGEVKRLGAVQDRQQQDHERVVVRLGLMSEHSSELEQRMTALANQMNAVTNQMNAVTNQMNAVTRQMGELTAQMGDFTRALGVNTADLTSLRADFVRLSATQGEFSAGLKRVSELLVKALGTTSDRFDDLEARVTRLEKKSA